MSTRQRPAFFRPVEFSYTGNAFSVSGGSSYSDFPQGTWANVMSLCHSVLAHLANDGVDIALALTDDLKFSWTPTGDITVTLHADLAEAFGFASTTVAMSNGVATVADYTPLYTWVAEFQRADQGGFDLDMQSIASGVESADGTWSGTEISGTRVYRTEIQLVNEWEYNLVSDAVGSDSSKRARCLEVFLDGALTAMPAYYLSVNPKGFWYYPDVNDAIDQCVLSTNEPWNEVTDNGVHFGYTDTANTRVFCAVTPDEIRGIKNGPSFPVGRLRFSTVFGFHTCPVPSNGWQYVDLSA
jgi:hypothetical protein